MKARLLGILLATAVLAGLASGITEHAKAQEGDPGTMPAASFVTLHGKVVIAGALNPNGMTIKAKIDEWESNLTKTINDFDNDLKQIVINHEKRLEKEAEEAVEVEEEVAVEEEEEVVEEPE